MLEVPEVVQIKASTFSVQRYLEEELGLSLAFVRNMHNLGFVIAGSAAAALVEVAHGVAPAHSPGEVDFFYKGYLLKGPNRHPDFSRTPALSELLSRYRVPYTNVEMTRRAWNANLRRSLPSQVFDLSPEVGNLPWEDHSLVPEPILSKEDVGQVQVQVVSEADPGLIRYGTLQALLLDRLERGEVPALTENSGREALGGWEAYLQELPARYDARKEAVPVWHRFAFTVACAELDGDTLIYHRNLLQDRKHKRLRLYDQKREFIGIALQVAQYRCKGYQLDSVGLLQLRLLERAVDPEEKQKLEELIERFSASDETPEGALHSALLPEPSEGDCTVLSRDNMKSVGAQGVDWPPPTFWAGPYFL